MKYSKKLLLIGCWCAFAVWLHAAEPTAQLASANQAYQKNDFATAIKGYELLLQQGYRSEALYYNLGNSYYRTNDLGKAVLNYERALLLDPNDADTKHNLQLVQSQLPDEIDPLPDFFLTKWWNGLAGLWSAQVWSILALILLWAGIVGLTLWLLGRVRLHKKIGFIAGSSLLIISLLAFALANNRTKNIQNSGRAVVLQREIVMRSAPDSESKEVMKLHAGETLKLLDQIGDWYKVSLRNGEQGWLPDQSFERI